MTISIIDVLDTTPHKPPKKAEPEPSPPITEKIDEQTETLTALTARVEALENYLKQFDLLDFQHQLNTIIADREGQAQLDAEEKEIMDLLKIKLEKETKRK